MGKGKTSKRDMLVTVRALKRNALLKKSNKKTFPKVAPTNPAE
ncbi:MAG: hypothetical protein SGJ04_04645 [Bacteroidota bacterium]|nr:hypothetical protein [Bacteroidota bacterium]